MKKSINQPWAVSDKFRARYGNTWADIDFVFQDKISADNFKTEPMGTVIGELHIANTTLTMRYKDLLSYSKSIEVLSNNLYAEQAPKTQTYEVSIKNRNFLLNRTEIGRLAETLNEAAQSTLRAYELGLYL